jgi:hypothetical protein
VLVVSTVLIVPASIITRAELQRIGVTRAALEAKLRTGRWRRIFPRVYATHSGTLRRDELLQAVLAYAGTDAALSHETAAALHRMKPTGKKKMVHVTLPDKRRIADQPGLTVHYSRRWPSSDRTRVRGLAVTTAQRTVLDLAGAAKTAGTAAAVVIDAVGSRRTTSERIRLLAESWPQFRNRDVILDVVTEAADGAHSPLELRHAVVCRRHALPVGDRQRREVLAGRVSYMDELLVPCDIVAEFDGKAGHSSALDVFRDHKRDNANAELGRSVLRVGWVSVLDEPCDVAAQRLRMLRRKGWTGPVRPCGEGCPLGR